MKTGDIFKYRGHELYKLMNGYHYTATHTIEFNPINTHPDYINMNDGELVGITEYVDTFWLVEVLGERK